MNRLPLAPPTAACALARVIGVFILTLTLLLALASPWLMVALADGPPALPPGLAIVPSASPGSSATVAAPQTSPWLLLISIGVPMVITVVKGLVPTIHKAWLPIIASSIGLLLALLDHYTGALGGNPMAVILLGAAGTGLREVADQVNQVLKTGAPKIPPALAVLFMLGMLTGSTVVVSGFMVGCASQSSERVTLTTVHGTLDAIDIAEQAYEAHLVAIEKRDGMAAHATERHAYLDTVAKFQATATGAINAWAALHGADTATPTAAQLAEISSEFAAAQAELMAIIAPYLPAARH